MHVHSLMELANQVFQRDRALSLLLNICLYVCDSSRGQWGSARVVCVCVFFFVCLWSCLRERERGEREFRITMRKYTDINSKSTQLFKKKKKELLGNKTKESWVCVYVCWHEVGVRASVKVRHCRTSKVSARSMSFFTYSRETAVCVCMRVRMC